MATMRPLALLGLLLLVCSCSPAHAARVLLQGNATDAAPSSLEAALEEVAASAGGLSVLTAAVKASGIAAGLPANTTYTILAPSDEAFAAALAALNVTAEELLGDTETLTQVLAYHIIPAGAVSSTDLEDGQTFTTALEGAEPLTVSLADGVQFEGELNTVSVVTPDVEVGGSIAHVVDAVLLPGSFAALLGGNSTAANDTTTPPNTTAELTLEDALLELASTAGLPTLAAALSASGLARQFNASVAFTILAPTEEAFAAALAALNLTPEQLLADTATLNAVLAHHVIPAGAVRAAELSDGQAFTTAGETSLTANLVDGQVVFTGPANSAKVVTADVAVPNSNSIVHTIDAVLLPSADLLPVPEEAPAVEAAQGPAPAPATSAGGPAAAPAAALLALLAGALAVLA